VSLMVMTSVTDAVSSSCLPGAPDSCTAACNLRCFYSNATSSMQTHSQSASRQAGMDACQQHAVVKFLHKAAATASSHVLNLELFKTTGDFSATAVELQYDAIQYNDSIFTNATL
jgi:hypothetical protein